jgi:hypothetical protein
MNETQIIQKQLATERAHFDEVAQVCAAWLGAGGRGAVGTGATAGTNAGACGSGADGDFVAACADYFAFAVTRFDATTARQLAAQLAGGPRPEFLQAFTEASRRHFERLDAMLSRNLPVTEWRAVSRIDADSIFAERTLYSRVKATIPP